LARACAGRIELESIGVVEETSRPRFCSRALSSLSHRSVCSDSSSRREVHTRKNRQNATVPHYGENPRRRATALSPDFGDSRSTQPRPPQCPSAARRAPAPTNRQCHVPRFDTAQCTRGCVDLRIGKQTRPCGLTTRQNRQRSRCHAVADSGYATAVLQSRRKNSAFRRCFRA